ncbi:hypothetical protein [Dysosmobacter sp.]|uniref:hypothetical protein n=1 Tax=Dysosmobacter sp. TaxID=2591382 RepID=UPI003FD86915
MQKTSSYWFHPLPNEFSNPPRAPQHPALEHALPYHFHQAMSMLFHKNMNNYLPSVSYLSVMIPKAAKKAAGFGENPQNLPEEK